jgi:hypothetical protein
MKIVKCFHADHGVTESLMAWAIEQVQPSGFFLRTLTLPEGYASLANGLYGPAAGDPDVEESEARYVQRTADRPPSRMVARAPRPSRLLTIIGVAEGDDVTVFTAYGGPAAEREPGDPTLKLGTPERDAAVAFWSKHALAGRPGLDRFEVRVTDPLTDDPDLVCQGCGERVCTVEHGDTLEVLVGVASDHVCGASEGSEP